MQAFTANAGEAKSEGTEISVTLRPLTGLTITAWGDYDDAVLTKPIPPAINASRRRLPAVALDCPIPPEVVRQRVGRAGVSVVAVGR